ncbi:MAG: perosamine synthetase [Acidobacteriota bacterium]|jgi:dTDP-4-amino-4,6-dideoxygalactose transaminase|nr:perosamine synthetase [Acidobacteriota bacterium]
MIHYAPRPPLSLLLRRPCAAMAEALAVAPARFQFSRDALHAWFGRRGGTVWFPSFHCGMEVRAAVDAGCAPRFYRVREDWTIDEDDFMARVSSEPGPVVLIHYFGFAQPGIERLARWCRERGVPLLEDCSHAFLSRFDGRLLGTFGDAATFSLYKTLGMVDGGALRDGDTPGAAPMMIAVDAQLAAWQKRRRDRAESDEATLRARFEARVVSARERIFAGPWRYGRGMSRLSLALASRVEPSFVIERRRENYRMLVRLLNAQVPDLDEGTVPLFLPLFVPRRTEALVRLQAARIEPFIFGMFHHPAMDAGEFPEAVRLRENLLCLPIHHQLRDADLLRIAEVLR